MLRNIFLFLIFIFGLNSNIIAQKIDYQNIDYPYLKHLIKKGIDSLRNEKDLPPLVNDSILYLAAKDHADYLLKTNNVGHNQPENKAKETPHQRITYYGGDYLSTGENVAQIFLFLPVKSSAQPGKTIQVENYKEAALTFVVGWKNSRGHYKNLMNPGYNITGMSVTYNPKTQALYAVQTFGTTTRHLPTVDEKAPVYVIDSTKKLQYEIPKPHRWHAWKIKPAKEKTDTRSWESFKRRFSERSFRLQVKDDSVFVHVPEKNRLRSLFRHKKDGLAIEIISLKDYVHDSIYYTKPSRRNHACIFNGTIPEPLYKEDLYQLIREQRKSKSLVINFGKIPDKLKDQLLEINLIVLKKNRIIDMIRYHHFRGDFLFYTLECDTLPYQFTPRKVDHEKKPDVDTLIHKVYFSRDETHIDSASKHKLISKFNFTDYKPYFGIVTAYASVEGPEDHNQSLYQQRAENLVKIVKNEYPDSFPLYIHTKENWDMFERQIQNTEYNFLKDESKAFVKKFLQLKQPLQDLDSRLDKQRYVNFYLISEEIITEQKTIDDALKTYIETHERIEKRIEKRKSYQISTHEKQKLSGLQHFIFNKIVEGKIPFNTLRKMPQRFETKYLQPGQKGYWQLELDYLKFLLTFKENTLNQQFHIYKRITELEKDEALPALNYAILVINKNYREQIYHPDKIDLEFLSTLKSGLNRINDPDSLPCYDELNLFYHTSRLLITYFENPLNDFSDLHNSTSYVYRHYSDTTLSEEIRFTAAKFLLLFDEYKYALNMINTLYMNGTTNKDIIRYYLVLYYSLVNISPSEQFTFLFDSQEYLSKEEWCKLFTGGMRLNFQILDYEIVRDLYCRNCGCE